MITEIRKAEDDHLDEELELLRELENDNYDSLPHKSSRMTMDANTLTGDHILVEDSQHADITLLGPDGSGDLSNDEAQQVQLGRDGKPLRVWKKKGMKRQTRRVISKSLSFPKLKQSD